MAKVNTLGTEDILRDGEKIFHERRWEYGIVVCPYCGSVHIKKYEGYRYKCNSCKNRFSDKTHTLLRNSKLSVGKWMQAIYEISIANQISSGELATRLKVNQKTAWLIRLKLDCCMKLDGYKLSGNIAQDEMYLGGCLTNFHYGRKIRLMKQYNYMAEDDKRYTKSAIYSLNKKIKTPVFGMNDGKNIVLYVTPNPVRRAYIRQLFLKHVSGDSVVIADESKLYDGWEKATGYKLYTNNHHNNQYKTEGGLTSNKIENTFSWFKRSYTARITHSKYTQLYLNEFCFRYNTRKLPTEERFNMLIDSMIGQELTYKQLREYNPLSQFKVEKRWQRHHYTMSDIKEMFDSTGGTIEYLQFGKTIYYRKDFE